MNEFRADAAKATEAQVIQLAHIRGCSKADAAKSVASTYAENLRLSIGTTMQAYWQAMVDVTDGLVASAGEWP